MKATSWSSTTRKEPISPPPDKGWVCWCRRFVSGAVVDCLEVVPPGSVLGPTAKDTPDILLGLFIRKVSELRSRVCWIFYPD